MRFSLTSVCALGAVITTVLAADNPFKNSQPGPLKGGDTYNIEWTPTAGDKTVSLVLMQGEPNNLTKVVDIQSSISNSGSYVWKVPDNIPSGNKYALKIFTPDQNKEPNYTSLITIRTTQPAEDTIMEDKKPTTESPATQKPAPYSSTADRDPKPDLSRDRKSTDYQEPSKTSHVPINPGSAISYGYGNSTKSEPVLEPTGTGSPMPTGSGAPTTNGDVTLPDITESNDAGALVSSPLALVLCAVVAVVVLN